MWLLTHSACLVSSFAPGLAVGRPAGGAGLAPSQEIQREPASQEGPEMLSVCAVVRALWEDWPEG